MKPILLLLVLFFAASCIRPVKVATVDNTPISVLQAQADTVLMVITPGNDDDRDMYIMDMEQTPIYQSEDCFDEAPLFLIFLLGLMFGVFIGVLIGSEI